MNGTAFKPLRGANTNLRFLARIVFRTRSGMIVGGGNSDADDGFVTDVNGLPMLPGSSLAGVLSHAYEAANDKAATEALFGTASAMEEAGGHASALVFSDAIVHLGNNLPAPQTAAPLSKESENLTAQLREGVRRDRVRIDGRGVADKRGKFDIRLVPAGARFTAEIELLSDEDHEAQAAAAWEQLLGLLRSPLLRFGGGTRSGLGGLDVESIRWDRFRLSDKSPLAEGPGSRAAYLAVPRDLCEAHGLPERLPDTQALHPCGAEVITLPNLRPVTHWLVDGGKAQGNEDFAPLTEPTIILAGNGLAVSEEYYLLPGSSLKGALAHRTRYHLHRHAGAWMTDDGSQPDGADKVETAFRYLFGDVAGAEGLDRHIGLLIVDDAYYDMATEQNLTHVALDRFSGGVRAGMLFQERVAAPIESGHTARLYLLDPPPGETVDPEIASLARDALEDALGDLRTGRLTLGAGAGRGWGGFACDAVETTRLEGVTTGGTCDDA